MFFKGVVICGRHLRPRPSPLSKLSSVQSSELNTLTAFVDLGFGFGKDRNTTL